ncbi:MAG: 16S rRNA (cytosine(1402)-N(4))-methyltransferase, partial [Bacteroidetes bacterium GWA2_31_9]
TFGGGGHSKQILQKLSKGKLYAFDADTDVAQNVLNNEAFVFVNDNYRFFRNYLMFNGVKAVDGILADLGVSSHQFDSSERGFSYRWDSELDMRMDNSTEKTAKIVLNTFTFEELATMFRTFGEIPNAGKLAGLIVKSREQKAINTVGDLTEAIKPILPRNAENKFLSVVFQALRIEVNSELEALKEMLIQAADILKPGGRLVVISYHSLEDRLVKNYIKAGNFEGELVKDIYGNTKNILEQINRKVIVPNDEEIKQNVRSRSAKMRIAVKNEMV